MGSLFFISRKLRWFVALYPISIYDRCRSINRVLYFLQQTNTTAITETDPQKLKERLQEAQLELQEYKIKLEKALQVRH